MESNPKKRAAPDARTAWVLIIPVGVDDYKHRGEAARSEVWLFDSEEKCKEKLNRYTLEALKNRLECYDVEEVEEVCEERKALLDAIKKYCEQESVDNGLGNISNYWTVRRDPTITPEDDEPISIIRGWVREAEYVPEKWGFEIKEMTIE